MTGTLPPGATLAQAKVWLMQQVQYGVRCPCCTQFAKEYVRKLNAGMAASLVRMYRAHGVQWQDKTMTLKGFGAAARDESLLRHWGLLEEAAHRRDDGGRAGWWRVTGLGEQFVLGRVTVASHVRLFNNRFTGFTGNQTRIEHCLNKNFDLSELMSLRTDVAS